MSIYSSKCIYHPMNLLDLFRSESGNIKSFSHLGLRLGVVDILAELFRLSKALSFSDSLLQPVEASLHKVKFMGEEDRKGDVRCVGDQVDCTVEASDGIEEGWFRRVEESRSWVRLRIEV